MHTKISDSLWASLCDLLPELEQEDRRRIDACTQFYRTIIARHSLSPATRKEVATVKSQATRLRQRILRLYSNAQFNRAGIDDEKPAPSAASAAQFAAVFAQLIEELNGAEVRFRNVSSGRRGPLEALVSQMLNIFCEKKKVAAPVSWPEISGGLRFHEFIRLCVKHASDGEVTPEDFDTAGRRATRLVHELGDAWDELLAVDPVLPDQEEG